MSENLNIVDENGTIIGQASRAKIHKEGLLHREVHVWLFTSDGKILFQHRAKDKDTWPDKLDASVGGHVDLGMDWGDTAVKELEEEAGIEAKPDELTYITQTHTTTFDPATQTTNNALRRIYAFRYDGKLDDLQIEKGKSQGFEAWAISELLRYPKQKDRFIPILFDETYLNIYRKIQELA